METPTEIQPQTDPSTQPLFTVQQVAEQTGLTTWTLRYYEKEGLIQPVARAESGHRRYSKEDVEWIRLLSRLRETGMPVAQMREFARLRYEGPHTAGRRRELLEMHRCEVVRQIAEREQMLALLDYKIARYTELETLCTDLDPGAAALCLRLQDMSKR